MTDNRERDAYVKATHGFATKDARVDWMAEGDSVVRIPLAVGAKALARAETPTASAKTRNPDFSIMVPLLCVLLRRIFPFVRT